MNHTISYHDVSRETFEETDYILNLLGVRIENYIDQLIWWNHKINLISRNVSRETIRAHIRHSLLLTQFEAYKQCDLIVDAGTGGGLPGIPLAIANPTKTFVLNDIIAKKALAVRQMAKKLNLTNTMIEQGSIEKIKIEKPFLLISKHAFKLNDLIKFTLKLPWNGIVMYKSIDFEEELNGVSQPLHIKAWNLATDPEDSFYKGKGLIIIKHKTNAT